VLSVRHLVKHFPVRGRGLLRRHVGEVHAVCDVSFDLYPHETLGLVGESGCGKTTTARVLLNLERATAGQVQYQGTELTHLPRRAMQRLRRELQIVFQDPYAALDPRLPVNEIIAEPLRIHGLYGLAGRDEVRELLTLVGLKPEHGNRFPHEFSGGQRQRVLNLLADLQAQLGLSYLFVSHDLSVVRHVADRLAVMYLGRIVETGPSEELFSAPAHPYTQALISAIPVPDPRKERARERIILTGDVPSAADPPSGCRFRTRCPLFATQLTASQRQRCTTDIPPFTDHGHGHVVACHWSPAASSGLSVVSEGAGVPHAARALRQPEGG
jgi:oligopeptide/dipeptide ABC transporter ATP-binding protein